MKKLLVALTVSAAALCTASGAYAHHQSSGGNGACALCKQTNIGKVETTKINISAGNTNSFVNSGVINGGILNSSVSNNTVGR